MLQIGVSGPRTMDEKFAVLAASETPALSEKSFHPRGPTVEMALPAERGALCRTYQSEARKESCAEKKKLRREEGKRVANKGGKRNARARPGTRGKKRTKRGSRTGRVSDEILSSRNILRASNSTPSECVVLFSREQ